MLLWWWKSFPNSFGYEYGRSSASVNEYFRFGLLTGRLKESVQVISDKQFPNFVYDIQVLYNTNEEGLPNDKLYVASGDHGVVEYSINEYIQNQTNIYLQGENDQTTFTGLLGEIWRGDGLGSRYGYENFSGAYGLAIYKNKYILVAHGVNGLSVINLKQENLLMEYSLKRVQFLMKFILVMEMFFLEHLNMIGPFLNITMKKTRNGINQSLIT